MSDESAERLLIIRSRVIERQHFSEYNLTSVQHILIDWFPRAIFRDLTSDTVSVDVSVQKEYGGGKLQFATVFFRGDGTEISRKTYVETHIQGAICFSYDPKNSCFLGNKEGYDWREVIYSDGLDRTVPMPRAT